MSSLLPRTAGAAQGGLEPSPRNLLLHRQRDELSAVVAADVLWRAPARGHRRIHDANHVPLSIRRLTPRPRSHGRTRRRLPAI